MSAGPRMVRDCICGGYIMGAQEIHAPQLPTLHSYLALGKSVTQSTTRGEVTSKIPWGASLLRGCAVRPVGLDTRKQED